MSKQDSREFDWRRNRDDPVIFCPMVERPPVEVVKELPDGAVAKMYDAFARVIPLNRRKEKIGVKGERDDRFVVRVVDVL